MIQKNRQQATIRNMVPIAKRNARTATGQLFLLVLLVVTAPLVGYTQELSNTIAQDISIDQKLDESINLGLPFTDSEGNAVQLGKYFGKGKPVILSLVYYECPMLCTQVLNGLVKTMKTLEFSAGEEYEVVTVSFDPSETPALASEKKSAYLKQYARDNAADGWHFLVGDSSAVRELASSVGFRYVYDEKSQQYAHGSAIMVLTPQGKISKYFYGIEYAPKDVKLGLMDASEERIGSAVDQLILLCFHYDPTTGKYGFAITAALQIMGVATFVGIAGFMLVSLRKERKNRNSGSSLTDKTPEASKN